MKSLVFSDVGYYLIIDSHQLAVLSSLNVKRGKCTDENTYSVILCLVQDGIVHFWWRICHAANDTERGHREIPLGNRR